MTGPGAAHLRLLRGRRQPNDVTCGASCTLAVSMLADPREAERLEGEEPWAAEVLMTHREITRTRDPRAPGLGLPWPRSLGTPPWAAARRLRAEPGGAWEVRTVRSGRGAGWAALVTSARNGAPSLLCVGTPTVPRHFLLVLPHTRPDHTRGPAVREAGTEDLSEAEARERLLLWDPARGEVRPLARDGFMDGALTGGSFPMPWFLVLREASRS